VQHAYKPKPYGYKRKTYGNRSYGKASKCIVIKWDTYKNKPSE
jgi:uncharacterized protein YycO